MAAPSSNAGPVVGAPAPADSWMLLWFEVMKPLMSAATDRGEPHLQAMVAFANHAQELALHRAQTATEPAVQRVAIADWDAASTSVMSADGISVKH
ncbi:hypothetical protein [Mycolicibacterium baixiangningiae]|uniref:hypothetical protein n=1 Tax=Mycolicibacterium baixiangningiae TaxID=2761578 RepID=UPI0018D00DE5